MRSAPLGPGHPTLPEGVRLEAADDRLTLVAERDLDGLGSGLFARPTAFVSFATRELVADRVELCGFGYTQFAMPLRTTLPRPLDLAPSATLASPPAMLPVLLRDAGGVTLLAPLDGWHDQIIAVVQDDEELTELRWGWHGDLDEVPAGFSTTLAVYRGGTAAEVLDRWGAEVRAAHGTTRPGRDESLVVDRLSYWTDNGAAYWYRTEPGLDLPTTLRHKLDELTELGVPVGAVELDSWFYPHQTSRPVLEVGYTESVPPTGMLEWDARPDVLPDGVDGLAERLGRPPLILHSRHIDPSSPYLDEGEWWTELTAQPVDPDFFRRWFVDARRWGATCIEQDWMLLYWFGCRELRRVPGRAREWQTVLDRLAAEHDMTLIWCMATPGDLLATVELDRIVAVRTSDDYRYAADPAVLWHWYLTVNALADALGLAAFADCSFTARLPDGVDADPLDGDPHPEVEALLQALSAGVVGIGDRIGRTDPTLVGRLVDDDGRLATSDTPVRLHDRSFFQPWDAGGGLTWATARAGERLHVVGLHTASTTGPITDELDLAAEHLLYDWRTGTAEAGSVVRATLAPRDWAHVIACPLHTDPDGRRWAYIGDPSRYVSPRHASELRPPPADDGKEPELRWWIEGRGLV